MAGLTVSVTNPKANPSPDGENVVVTVTETGGGGASVPLNTTADYKIAELKYVSAVPTPTSVSNGHIVWPQVMMPDSGYTYTIVFTCESTGNKTVKADAAAGTSTGKGDGDVAC